MTCPKCGKPLKEWYSAAGGETIIACSDIKCTYKAKQEKII